MEHGVTYIDGKDIGGLAESVMADRKVLFDDGMLIIALAIDTRSNTLLDEPTIYNRGIIQKHNEKAIEDCRQLRAGRVRNEVFDDLEATWDFVASCGYDQYVGIDFSLLGSFDYYTGLIMEAFAPGFGKPIGSGGRYDDLLQVFGGDLPAAGFAFSLERLMHALARQGALEAPEREVEVVDVSDADAFKEAMELHAQCRAAQIGGGRE